MENDFILDDEMLEKINKFTRGGITADEVFTFPIVLCDNEIDRDNEQFSIDALHKLAQLFMGKTGIFDHNPKGENQTARIFDCEVKSDLTKTTASGEPYTYLVAKAYLMRTPKTQDLIAEINGGIKKEVSVGCKIEKHICSICSADQRENPCVHTKGNYYNGKLCSIILDEPSDAYEWSFVAVPAQKNAGVTKTYSSEKSESKTVKALSQKLCDEQKNTAKACEILRREIMSLSFMCRPIMAVETVKTLCDKMSFSQLEDLYENLKVQAHANCDEKSFQLEKKTTCENQDNNNYKL